MLMIPKICKAGLLLMLLAASSLAQVVKIPDPNFKSALIQNKVDYKWRW